jgi:hypothetical protein
MFHAFQIYVAYVSSGCCKSRSGVALLQWLYTCVASVCFKYFSCFKRMLQVFHLDVAYVAVTIHVCCKCVLQMFQLFHLDVACFYLDAAYVAVAIPVCCKCMFQMFHLFQMYVARFIWMLHMLLWLYTYVVNVCFNYFTWFQYVADDVAPHVF